MANIVRLYPTNTALFRLAGDPRGSSTSLRYGSSWEFANSSSGEDTESSSECDLDDNFESDITTLRDYSFVAISENSMVFTMHRLV
ncbi:hypothetical protein N7486_005029 [Penicillium sp. IBT 16267x]|nr:hypothetical protein N7486_005029 [Penicillium sp. IBT 16267x]